MHMKTFTKGLVVGLILLAGVPQRASAWQRERAEIFAILPEGSSGPEGLEVGANGDVYVTTFGFQSAGPVTGSGQLFVYDQRGRLIRQVTIVGSTSHLLGLRFHPLTGALLVIDFQGGKVLNVDPVTGNATAFMTLPSPLPHPEITSGAGLNDITFDRSGRVYVSDSFQGVVWTTGREGGVATVWVDSPLLRTAGVPPFGANGLRFNRDETVLFVANTGDDTVIKVPATSGSGGLAAGTPAVFTNSINGADGLLIDDEDNLWVVANQADEIVVVDPSGKAIAKLGDFGGLSRGHPVQMLFPASLRFHGKDLLVTNLSLDLRLFGASLVAVDSEWCRQVTRYTVVRIPARITGPSRHDDD
jgi:sugar lactone lactonase YvrE